MHFRLVLCEKEMSHLLLLAGRHKQHHHAGTGLPGKVLAAYILACNCLGCMSAGGGCRDVAVRQTRSSCQQMLTGQGADSIYLLCLQPPGLYVSIRSGPYSKQHHRPCKRSKVHCLQHIMGLLLPGICREHACMHAWRSIMSHMRTGMRRSRARGRTSAEAGHPQLATGPSGGQRLRWVACRGQGGEGKERWQLRERPVMEGENK